MPKKIVHPCSFEEEKHTEQALRNWQQAMIHLHRNYTELITYLNQPEITKKQLLPVKLSLGQCPRNQLEKLICRMQIELERLIQDMERSDILGNGVSPQKLAKKLAAHTVVVAQLNDQAQTRLQLINQSAS